MKRQRRRMRQAHAASADGWLRLVLSRKISEPYSVGKSRDWMISLAPNGSPNRGFRAAPARPPARMVSSAVAASMRVAVSPRWAQAPTTPSAKATPTTT